MEQKERGKQWMLEYAKELENMADDDPCFSEEDRARWRHFKNKFPGYIRWIADGNGPSAPHHHQLIRSKCCRFLSVPFAKLVASVSHATKSSVFDTNTYWGNYQSF